MKKLSFFHTPFFDLRLYPKIVLGAKKIVLGAKELIFYSIKFSVIDEKIQNNYRIMGRKKRRKDVLLWINT